MDMTPQPVPGVRCQLLHSFTLQHDWKVKLGIFAKADTFYVYWVPDPELWTDPKYEPRLAVFADCGRLGLRELETDWKSDIICYKKRALPLWLSCQIAAYGKWEIWQLLRDLDPPPLKHTANFPELLSGRSGTATFANGSTMKMPMGPFMNRRHFVGCY